MSNTIKNTWFQISFPVHELDVVLGQWYAVLPDKPGPALPSLQVWKKNTFYLFLLYLSYVFILNSCPHFGNDFDYKCFDTPDWKSCSASFINHKYFITFFSISNKCKNEADVLWKTVGLLWIASLVTRQPLWCNKRLIFDTWNYERLDVTC